MYYNNHHLSGEKRFCSFFLSQGFILPQCATFAFTHDSLWCSNLLKCYQWEFIKLVLLTFRYFFIRLCNFFLSGVVWCPKLRQLFSCPRSGIKHVSWSVQWCSATKIWSVELVVLGNVIIFYLFRGQKYNFKKIFPWYFQLWFDVTVFP